MLSLGFGSQSIPTVFDRGLGLETKLGNPQNFSKPIQNWMQAPIIRYLNIAGSVSHISCKEQQQLLYCES